MNLLGRRLFSLILSVTLIVVFAVACSAPAVPPPTVSAPTTAPAVAAPTEAPAVSAPTTVPVAAAATEAPAVSVPTTAPTETVAASAAQTSAGTPFKMGLLAPLSGYNTASGDDMRDALQLWVGQHNTTIAGRPLQLFVEDTAGDANTSVEKARKLVENDQVDIVLGPENADEANATADWMCKNQALLLLVVPAGEDLTIRHRCPYVLRSSWTAPQPIYPFADYIYNTLGYKKVAAISKDYDQGYEQVGALQRRLVDLGGSVVKKIWTPSNTTDFGPYLSQIPTGVDAVFAMYGGSDALAFLQSYSDFGLKGKVPLITSGTFSDEATLAKMNDNALGIVNSLQYSAVLSNTLNVKFQQDFKAKYGRGASYYAEHTYDGATVVEGLLTQLGDNFKDPTKLNAALQTLKLDLPRGPISFDAYNGVVENIYIRKVERVNGALQNTVIATIPSVSQFGPYDPKVYVTWPSYSKDFTPPQK